MSCWNKSVPKIHLTIFQGSTSGINALGPAISSKSAKIPKQSDLGICEGDPRRLKPTF